MEEVLQRFSEVENRLAEVSLCTERIEGRSRGWVEADPPVLRSRRRRGDTELTDDSDDWDEKPTHFFGNSWLLYSGMMILIV